MLELFKSSDTRIQKILLMEKIKFTGRLIAKDQQNQSWIFYLDEGKVVYATGGKNLVRRWQRNLRNIKTESELKELFLSSQFFSTDKSLNLCWEYQLLSLWVEQQQLSSEQASKIVQGIVAEVIFDVFEVENLVYQTKIENYSFSPLVLLTIETMVAETYKTLQIWQQIKFANFSPNQVPLINQPEVQQQQILTPDSQILTDCLNGQDTLRDIAIAKRQNFIEVFYLLVPYLKTGLIKLVEVPDLPVPNFSITPVLTPIADLSKSGSVIAPLSQFQATPSDPNNQFVQASTNNSLLSAKKVVVEEDERLVNLLNWLWKGKVNNFIIENKAVINWLNRVINPQDHRQFLKSSLYIKNQFTKVPGRQWAVIFLLLLIGSMYLLWKSHTPNHAMLTAVSPSKELNQINQTSTSSNTYSLMRDVPNVPKGLFNYGGAIVFAPLRSPTVIDAIAKAQPQFQLRYVDPAFGRPGAHKGVAMLLDNELSFSQNAIPLDDAEYSRAKDRGYRLQEIPVGINGIVFYTQLSLRIPGLSMDKLRDIFTGKITNWKQVGGPNLAIIPIGIDPRDSSTFKILLSEAGGPSSARVRVVRDWTACIRETSRTPGGISFGSMATVVRQQTVRPLALAKGGSNQYVSPYIANGQVNAQAIRDGSYPFTYPVFVDVRRDGTRNEQAGVAYANLLLSKEGQDLVTKAGFVPLN